MTFQVEEIYTCIRSSFKTYLFKKKKNLFFFYNATTKVIYFAFKIPYMRWHYIFFFTYVKPLFFKIILIGS